MSMTMNKVTIRKDCRCHQGKNVFPQDPLAPPSDGAAIPTFSIARNRLVNTLQNAKDIDIMAIFIVTKTIVTHN